MAIAPPAEAQLLHGAHAHMVTRGYFRILNFFDIAEAIDLEKLRALLGSKAAPRSPGFVHLTPEYAQAQNAPLEEPLEPVTLSSGEKLGGKIKYYWFGVASVELTTPFQCDLNALCGDSYRWMNAPEVEKAAEDTLRARLQRFQPALIKPSSKWLDEDYLVIDIQSASHEDGRPPTAKELLTQYGDQITELVRGELTPLSAAERDEILRDALSYYPTDLIVVVGPPRWSMTSRTRRPRLSICSNMRTRSCWSFATTTKSSPIFFQTYTARWRATKAFSRAGACRAAPAA